MEPPKASSPPSTANSAGAEPAHPARGPTPHARLLTREFLLLLVVQLCYGTAFSTLFILPKYLIVARGASAELVGNAHGAFALAAAVCVPWLGRWLDERGRTPVMIAGILLGLVSFAPLGFVSSSWAVLALRALHGVSFSMVFSAGSALAVDLAPTARRAEGVGYFATAMLVTNGFGPLLAEQWSQSFGWASVFVACSGYCLAALGAAWQLRPNRTQPSKQDSSSYPAAGSPATTHPTAQLVNPKPARSGLGMQLSAALAGAYLALFAIGIGVGTSKTFIPALMTVEGAATVTPYFVAYTAGALLQRTLLARVPDRVGWLSATLASLGLYALSLVWIAAAPLPHLAWIAALVGVSHGGAFPAASALAAGAVPSTQRGRVAAWGTGFFNAGFALSASGLARFEARVGYRGLIALGAAALTLCAVVAWRLSRTPPLQGPQSGYGPPAMT